MTLSALFSLSLSLSLLAVVPTVAQSDGHIAPLHSKFTQGETLRYLIQRDPYFCDPEGAVDSANAAADYQPPVVERLTETVQAVDSDGRATLVLTLMPEPGFEDEAHPQPTLTRTVTVAPSGRLLAVNGGALGSSPAERDLVRGLPPLLAVRSGHGSEGYINLHQALPVVVSQYRTPNHDGMLLRTTYAAQSDQFAFDSAKGYLVREDSTLTISSTLLMTQRGRRGAADFGHVVPHTQVIQTLSLELQEATPPPATRPTF